VVTPDPRIAPSSLIIVTGLRVVIIINYLIFFGLMSRDQYVGIGLLVVSIVVILVYGYLMFLPPGVSVFGMSVDMFLLKLTALLAVLVIFGVLAWIGYTLATTPPPKPIEEIEKEIEAELKKLEEESKEQKQ
jgi:predicted DNA-binding transcriptional regulator